MDRYGIIELVSEEDYKLKKDMEKINKVKMALEDCTRVLMYPNEDDFKYIDNLLNMEENQVLMQREINKGGEDLFARLLKYFFDRSCVSRVIKNNIRYKGERSVGYVAELTAMSILKDNEDIITLELIDEVKKEILDVRYKNVFTGMMETHDDLNELIEQEEDYFITVCDEVRDILDRINK